MSHSLTPDPAQFAPPEPKRSWYQRKLVVIPSLVVAATVGFGIGSSDSEDAAATPQPTPEPQTITKTETVTEQVEVTPGSCLDALDAADEVRSDAADFGGLMIRMSTVNRQWPDLVLDAARAGVNVDAAALDDITTTVQGMTADTKQINHEMNDLATETGRDTDRYLAASEHCRSAS